MHPAPTPSNIRHLRQHLGLSQTAFGSMLHSSMRAVQNWEAGLRKINPATWALALIQSERIKPLPALWPE